MKPALLALALSAMPLAACTETPETPSVENSTEEMASNIEAMAANMEAMASASTNAAEAALLANMADGLDNGVGNSAVR